MNLFLSDIEHIEEYSSNLRLERNPDYLAKLDKFVDRITGEYPEWIKLCSFNENRDTFVIRERKLGDIIFGIKVIPEEIKILRYKGGPEFNEWKKKASNVLDIAIQVFVGDVHQRISYIDIKFTILYEDSDGSLSKKLTSSVQPSFINALESGVLKYSQFSIIMPGDCLLAIALGKDDSEGDTAYIEIGYAQRYSTSIDNYNAPLIEKTFHDGKHAITSVIKSIY